jgi:hypothetical protein
LKLEDDELYIFLLKFILAEFCLGTQDLSHSCQELCILAVEFISPYISGLTPQASGVRVMMVELPCLEQIG